MPVPLGQLITAMATPFDAAGGVDHEGAARLARHLVETGSDGLVVFGTTGEGPTLEDGEKLDLLTTVLDAVAGSAAVVANTGSNSTRHSVELTREALARGADAFLAVTPYYNKPPTAGIVAHFEAVAAAAGGRPVIAYNIPQRVVLNMAPSLLRRLGEIDNVVAVKQATTDLAQAREIVETTALALYAGSDELLLPFLELGAAGGICVASHVAGRLMREEIDAVAAGDLDRARRLDAALRPLYAALSVTINPIPLKAAMALQGLPAGGLRLPLVEATASERAAVRDALAAIPAAAAVL